MPNKRMHATADMRLVISQRRRGAARDARRYVTSAAMILVSLAVMNMLTIVIVFCLAFSFTSPVSSLKQDDTVASVAERTIKEKEPEWALVRTCINGCGGMRMPNEEEDGATFEWKRRGSRAGVNTFKLKAEENAKDIFFRATVTAITREKYKPNREGESLTAMVDAVEFYKNRAGNGYVESYGATFMKGKVVVIVRASSAGVAQHFALLIAKSLPAT